jgi:hypothetical protein
MGVLCMLLMFAILEGCLVMMGQHSRSESLFYYFRLEDQVPENHLLRLIDARCVAFHSGPSFRFNPCRIGAARKRNEFYREQLVQ